MAKPKRIEPTHDWKQLQLRLAFPDQHNYELIRPVVLFGQPASDRALETGEPIRTITRHLQRFTQEGFAGLTAAAYPPPVVHSLPAELRQLIIDLKAEHAGLSTHEIGAICYVRSGRRPHAQTINRVLTEHPPPATKERRFPRYHEIPDPAKRRVAIIRLHMEGWTKQSIAEYLHISRTTVYATLKRWATEGVGGLYAKSKAPKKRVRKITLKIIQRVRQLQQNPGLGAFRIHAALKQEGISDISPRSCGRILKLNRDLYKLQGPLRNPRTKKEMPFRAVRRHQFWSVDIRYIDHALGGGNVYSITILENYSRAILASALTRTQDLSAYLIVLYAAIRNHGVPEAIVSDGGGVFRAKQALEIYAALGITKEQIERRKPWQNYIETAFNVQRRMADHDFMQATTWAELVDAHHRWVGNYNYQVHWAHQARVDGRHTPEAVLAWILGVVYDEAALHRIFYSTRFKRRLDKAGYLRFRHWRMYGEEGLERREVAVWLYKETLSIVFADQPLAQYSVEYQADQKHLTRVKAERVFETQHASPQLTLWELGEEDWLKVHRLANYAPRKKQEAEAAPELEQAVLPLDLAS